MTAAAAVSPAEKGAACTADSRETGNGSSVFVPVGVLPFGTGQGSKTLKFSSLTYLPGLRIIIVTGRTATSKVVRFRLCGLEIDRGKVVRFRSCE